MPIETRSIGPDDADAVRLALYLAVTWNRDDAPPLDIALQHPELTKYWSDWGREGDFGVLAEHDGALIGAAYARLYHEGLGSYGYVRPDIPEVGIGLLPDHRGAGLGSQLIQLLEAEATRCGFDALSLSVNLTNPARRLYAKLGYVELDRTEDSARMIKLLA